MVIFLRHIILIKDCRGAKNCGDKNFYVKTNTIHILYNVKLNFQSEMSSGDKMHFMMVILCIKHGQY